MVKLALLWKFAVLVSGLVLAELALAVNGLGLAQQVDALTELLGMLAPYVPFLAIIGGVVTMYARLSANFREALAARDAEHKIEIERLRERIGEMATGQQGRITQLDNRIMELERGERERNTIIRQLQTELDTVRERENKRFSVELVELRRRQDAEGERRKGRRVVEDESGDDPDVPGGAA